MLHCLTCAESYAKVQEGDTGCHCADNESECCQKGPDDGHCPAPVLIRQPTGERTWKRKHSVKGILITYSNFVYCVLLELNTAIGTIVDEV